jgi:phosphoglycolate phosphatase
MTEVLDLLDVDAILLDFDGTIIDSYPGIQEAFDKAYFMTYARANNVSIKPFIGPAISQILQCVNNETDVQKIEAFIRSFKNIYDTDTYRSSVLYAGIFELLEILFRAGIDLFIVTNKRGKATELIARYLEIEHFFSGFYCSDSKEQYSSKAEIVKDVLEVEELDSAKCIFIGDTSQDENSALQNNIPFVYAAYGYGDLQGIQRTIQHPIETLNFINYLKK